MDWHVMRKLLPSALLLAVPGVLLNTVLTGCFVMVGVEVNGRAPHFQESLLLGSILSATDPVAVVAALAQLGAPKKLSSLVEGESLLNDGSAVVFSYVFLDWSSRPNPDKKCPGDPPSGGCVFGYFLQVAGGGMAIGLAVAWLLLLWINIVRPLQFPAIELSIVFTAIYGTFFLAEALHTSGVLAVVTLGFLMSAGLMHRMSHEGRHNHHTILHQVAYVCNQVAFFVAGIVSARFIYSKSDSCSHTLIKGRAWLELFALYFMCHLTRAGVILSFWPFLKKWGYGITWKEACIMVYGGLRGAVGLIMGLIVEHNAYIDPDLAQMVAFHTSGIVFLTLFINGSTIDGLYRNLKMYPQNSFRMTHLRRTLYKLETECQKVGIKRLCEDWFFHDCHFRKVIRCVPNFNHIYFNEAGLPAAAKIESVSESLNHLAHDALEYRLVMHSKSDRSKDFGSLWQSRKVDSEKTLIELLNSASEVQEKKDYMRNISNTGDKLLDYNPPDFKAHAGFYVSAKSADQVFADMGNMAKTTMTTRSRPLNSHS
jgi:NhaP-type Na+/H+ or K+/H+ antiporter